MELQGVEQAAEQQSDACKHTSSPQHYPILHFPRIFRRGQAEFSAVFLAEPAQGFDSDCFMGL